uniref:GPI inositol-deacylase n=1 Tax=Oryza brachyantha TaxID=4533 RepID=J3N164_ORYBR
MTEALKGIGYNEEENLFGAPYDSRYVSAPPGMHAMAFSSFMADLRRLAEHASGKNGGRAVILVTHSMGGLMAVEFLTRSPVPWRKRYVKHLVMVSTGAGGIVAPLRSLAASAHAPPSSLAGAERSYGSAFAALPSPKVFGDDQPLVVTRRGNYSARDMPELLAAVGFSGSEIHLYRTRALPVTLGFRAPRVPVTAVYGAGVPTPEQLVYWDGDFSKDPEVMYGDGDGAVNLQSVLALTPVVGEDPEQGFFKAVKIANATHGAIIRDEFALNGVITEYFFHFY